MIEVKTLTMRQYWELVKSKPIRRKPVQRESQLQQAAVRWFRLTYPKYRYCFWANANGGQRNAITGARMKKEGVLPGLLDLTLAVARNGFHGAYIEMKVDSNKLSKEQIEVIDSLQGQGYFTTVCYSLADFQQAINAYLS